MYVLVYSFRPRLDMKYELYVTSIIEPVGVLVIGAALLLRAPERRNAGRAHVAASFIAFLAAPHLFDRTPSRGRTPRAAADGMETPPHGSAAMGGMELVGNLQSRAGPVLRPLPLSACAHPTTARRARSSRCCARPRRAFSLIWTPIAQGLFRAAIRSTCSARYRGPGYLDVGGGSSA